MDTPIPGELLNGAQILYKPHGTIILATECQTSLTHAVAETRLMWQIDKLNTKWANHVPELFYHCKLRKFIYLPVLQDPQPCSSIHMPSKFWPPLHQNTFGDRALLGPDDGAYTSPETL